MATATGAAWIGQAVGRQSAARAATRRRQARRFSHILLSLGHRWGAQAALRPLLEPLGLALVWLVSGGLPVGDV